MDRGTAHDSGVSERKLKRATQGCKETEKETSSHPGWAGHVTIPQNMGSKKSVALEGWQSVLFIAVTNFGDFKSSSSSLCLNIRFIGVRN